MQMPPDPTLASLLLRCVTIIYKATQVPNHSSSMRLLDVSAGMFHPGIVAATRIANSGVLLDTEVLRPR
jgi:hypothetical protein